MSVLFIFCIISGSAVFYRILHDIRQSLSSSLLLHAGYALTVAEASSHLTLFQPSSILLSWILLATAWGIYLLTAFRKKSMPPSLFTHAWQKVYHTTPYEKILLSMIVALIGATGFIGCFSVPNNWDSLTYHLPRVLMWFQNQSIGIFRADDFRMLYNPPLSEILNANAYVLTNRLQGMNSVQWLAYILLSLEVSTLARVMGAARERQWEAALLALTIPTFVMQAATTQNDLLTAAFLVSAASFFHHAMQKALPKNTLYPSRWFLGIAAASLALTTKATALFFLPFILIVPMLQLIKHKQWPIILTLLLIIVPSSGWLIRNNQHFGNPLGYHNEHFAKAGINYYANEYLSPAQMAGSIAKHITLFTATPIPQINKWQENIVRDFHSHLQVDPDDPRLRWYGVNYHVPQTGPHEDAPPVIWHSLIVLILLFVHLTYSLGSKHNITSHHNLCILFYVVGFAATASYVKWMPWNIRFMSIWLLFIQTVLVATLWPLKKTSQIIWRGTIGFSFLIAIPFALFAIPRSVIPFTLAHENNPIPFVGIFSPPMEQLLPKNPKHVDHLEQMARVAVEHSSGTIGIMRYGTDPAVFPIMYAAKQQAPRMQFQFITPGNGSTESLIPDNAPDVVVILGERPIPSIDGYIQKLETNVGSIWHRTGHQGYRNDPSL